MADHNLKTAGLDHMFHVDVVERQRLGRDLKRDGLGFRLGPQEDLLETFQLLGAAVLRRRPDANIHLHDFRSLALAGVGHVHQDASGARRGRSSSGTAASFPMAKVV